MKYYPHHIGDFDKKTRHLTRLERSVYRDMLDMYYDTEKPLPLDIDVLCRRIIARTNEERTAVEQVLNEFFTASEHGWVNDRCDSEIEAFRRSVEQKSAAGKASAAKRATKNQQPFNGRSTDDATDDATGDERQQHGDPTNQEPITNNQEPSKKDSGQGKASGYSPEFENAWSLYPKRAGGNSKADAFKAWTARLKADATVEELTEGTERYAAFIRATCKEHTEYVKQAATFYGPSKHYAEPWTPPRNSGMPFSLTSQQGASHEPRETVERI